MSSPKPRPTGISTSAWIRPAVLAASFLVVGFVAGWALRGGGASTATIPRLSQDYLNQVTTPIAGGSGTTTDGTSTAAGTPADVTPPDRGEVSVIVLNGTSQNGLAATTADRLRAISYTTVSTGNIPAAPGAPTVYYRTGQRLAGVQLASDLAITETPKPLPATGPVATVPPKTVQVVVVLRAG
ncbi:MAG: LytR C-terminal domain-containing protein [Actinobacteria bacterium]|nr:LytR C-terminal domain-containing protein [Actinomycetota bacterium]